MLTFDRIHWYLAAIENFDSEVAAIFASLSKFKMAFEVK